MRKLIKSILPEVGVGDLKIRPRGDNRCESANWGGSPNISHVAHGQDIQLQEVVQLSLSRGADINAMEGNLEPPYQLQRPN